MKNSDLKKALSVLPSPPINSASRERGLHRALIALGQPRTVTQESKPASRARPVLRMVMLACVGAVLASTFVLHERYQPSRGPLAESRVDVGALIQMQALFRGQLNAVIEHDGEVRLDLAEGGQPTADGQPVVVQLERGENRVRLVGYCGRIITLELDGAQLTFEALVTSDDEVILAGDAFAWSRTDPQMLAGYRVQARAPSSL